MYLELNIDAYNQIIDTCAQCVDKGIYARDVLKRICIRVFPNNKVQAVAMDGNAMAITYCEAVGRNTKPITKPTDMLIYPVKAPKDAIYVSITDQIAQGRIQIVFNTGTSFEQLKCKSKYIDYDKIVPNDMSKFALRVSFDPRYMHKIMQSMLNQEYVTFYFSDNELKPCLIDGDFSRCMILPKLQRDIQKKRKQIQLLNRKQTHE